MIITLEYNGTPIYFKKENGVVMVNLASLKLKPRFGLFDFDYSAFQLLVGQLITDPYYRDLLKVQNLSELHCCVKDSIWIHRYLAVIIATQLDYIFQVWLLSAIEKVSKEEFSNVKKDRKSKSRIINEDFYRELILTYFDLPEQGFPYTSVTCSQICEVIQQASGKSINNRYAGIVLKKIGFVQQRNKSHRFYNVKINMPK